MKQTTCARTLFRLRNVRPNVEAMLDALVSTDAAHRLSRSEPRVLDHFPVPAIAVDGYFAKDEADWCPEYSEFVAEAVSYPTLRPAGLILLAVDDGVYALAYGEGHRLLPGRLKEPKFGLRFIIRASDPDDIRAAVARTAGRGRTDIAMLPGGAPVATLGIDECTRRVEGIKARLRRPELTAGRDGDGRVQAAFGGTGLHLPYGADPTSLVADIRIIDRVCREEPPHPELEFVERVTQVSDQETVELLDLELGAALGRPDEIRLAAAVPEDCLADYERARAFGIKIGTSEEHLSPELDIDYLLRRLRFHREHNRLDALRSARVTLYDNARARTEDVLRNDRLFRWIETELILDARRFVLMDRTWHEFDRAYLESITATVTNLINPAPRYPLPAWLPGQTERDYNIGVGIHAPGFVSLDRALVSTTLHRGNGVEICDLLAPDDSLVMVKPAARASVLSHLFNQGLSAVDALLHSAQARADFGTLVTLHGRGRRLPENFRPRKVVFAIHLKTHRTLTADTLFPLAQVALVEAARKIRGYGIEVEVIGIPPADPAEYGALGAA